MSNDTFPSRCDDLNGGKREARELPSDPRVCATGGVRRKREFTPDERKDRTYWIKRNRNNEAAKRSRLRKRTEERLLQRRALELQRENECLREALAAVYRHGSSGYRVTFQPSEHAAGVGSPSSALVFSSCCGATCGPTPLFGPVYGLFSCGNAGFSPFSSDTYRRSSYFTQERVPQRSVRELEDRSINNGTL